jgi:hypothetical protein
MRNGVLFPVLHSSHARVALLFSLLFCSAPAQAQFIVQRVNLAYLTQRADIIVQGRITDVRHVNLPGYPNIPTVEIQLKVENMLRGPDQATYTFREVFLGLRGKEGKQGYKIGQRLLLFLPAPSQYGLSSPVGIEQGRFHIGQNTGESSAMIVNEHGNAGLFKNVENSADKSGIRLTKRQLHTIGTASGAVALDDFISLVQSLKSLPRIQ